MARNSGNQRNSSRGSSSNKSDQPLMSGWMDSARERPMAAAAAVGGAVAAGVFLWSRRNQISDQLSTMSDQISQWTEDMRSGGQGEASTGTARGRTSNSLGTEPSAEFEMAGAGTSAAKGSSRATGGRSGKAQSGQNMSPSRTATGATNF